MLRKCCLLCVLALGGLLPVLAWAKPPAGIDVQVKVGYDDFVQLGRINPVIVDMTNASAGKNLSGELLLKYNGVEYVTPLELPAPSAKRFFLYFPCDNYAPYLTLQVRTKQWTEFFDINAFFKTAKTADTAIVVLTNQTGALGVLNQLSTVRLYRDMYVDATSAIGSSKTYVSYFKLDQVDANPKFFARADVIVLADIDYRQVTPQLAEALKACAAGGTTVVFSLGLDGVGVAGSPLAELCPLHATGTVQLTDLGSFGRHYGISAQGSPATFAVGQLEPGATVLAEANGRPAVVRRYWGSGAIMALAFDVTAQPFKQNPRLANLFLDSALTVPENVQVRNWFVHPEPISKILMHLAEADPMPPSFVLFFLLAYVALVGPANFLLLRQLRRQTLVWLTIPLIIGGFAYGGLETGRLTRGADNVTSAFQELHVYPNASYTPYQTVMLIFTAERTHYNLTVPDESAFMYADIPQQLEQYAFHGGVNPAQLRGLTGSKMDNSTRPEVQTTQGKWTSKEYFYQGYAKLPLKVDAALTAQRSTSGPVALQGSVTLDLPFNLRDCYLYTGGGTTMLGDVDGKGTLDLGQVGGGKYAPWKPPSTEEAREVFGRSAPAGLQGNYLFDSRTQLADLQRGASSKGLDYRDEMLLVGFTDKVEELAEFKRPHKKYALTMVVIHLPYTQRNAPDAEPAVRTLITGGTGFTVDSKWAYYGNDNDQQLSFEPNGYLDLSVQLLGRARQANRMTITTNASLDRNSQVKPAEYVTAYGWDGAGWRELPTHSDLQSLDFSLAGLPDSAGIVKLRLVSKVDGLKLTLPHAEAY